MEAPVTWTPTPTCLSVSKSLLNGWRKVGKKVNVLHYYSHSWLLPFKCWAPCPWKPGFRSPRGTIFLLGEQYKIDVFLWKKKILKLKEGLMSLCGGHCTAWGWVPVHRLMLCDTKLWLKVFRQIKTGFKPPSKLAILNISHCSCAVKNWYQASLTLFSSRF